MANLSNKVQQALLEFYQGIKTIERLRLQAKGDEYLLDMYRRVAAHGLSVTEEALTGVTTDTEHKAKEPKTYADFASIVKPPNGYLN